MAATDNLQRLGQLAAEVGAREVATEAEELAHRVAAGRFYVACVGEFKRGKSTLINSLIGTAILPTGVAPVTSVPTVVCHGTAGVRIRHDGAWRPIERAAIADYVSQERNPGNSRRVSGVEVSLPLPLLQNGLCLVDTPGLGSVFQANTASANEFLPNIDAAVVVLGADPPISGDELQFIVRLAQQVATLLFVLNKMDRVGPAERSTAAAFTRRVLADALGTEPGAIFQISAIAPGSDPEWQRDWSLLTDALARLARQSGVELSRVAAERGASRLATRLERLITEERRAIMSPLEESERRLETLLELVASAERAACELGPLLAAEENRLVEVFTTQRREFLARVLPETAADLARRYDRAASRDAMLALALDIAQRALEPWLRSSEAEAEHRYAAAMSRFAGLAATLLQRSRQLGVLDDGTADSLVEAPPQRLTTLPRTFQFTRLQTQHESPLPWMRWLSRLSVRFLSRRRLGAAERYLVHLLTTNAERVENDLRQRVHEERQRLEAQLQRMIAGTAHGAARALERGRAVRAAGGEAVRATLERQDGWLVRLQAL